MVFSDSTFVFLFLSMAHKVTILDKKIAILYTIIPCFNEDKVLRKTAACLEDLYQSLIRDKKISENSRICFINDGSTDHTWDIIQDLHGQNKVFSGINLSCNRGHQNALLAGLMTVRNRADMVISMDADLQDDIHACEEMVEKYYQGYDVVYGVRNKRNEDTFFKRFSAETFYKLMNWMGAKTVYNHADYRLMSRRVLNCLSEYGEVHLYLRGIIPLIGYKSEVVYYERTKRFAGETKYSFKKMVGLALDGITSFSIKPIHIIESAGLCIFLVSIVLFLCLVIGGSEKIKNIQWILIIISIWNVGGVVLISLGVIGEYIGKIHFETKRRPRYVVEQFLDE